MNCNVTTGDRSVLAQTTCAFIVHGSAVLLTLISFVFLYIVQGIDQSLREILISFQLANLVGLVVCAHDTYMMLCGAQQVILDGDKKFPRPR